VNDISIHPLKLKHGEIQSNATHITLHSINSIRRSIYRVFLLYNNGNENKVFFVTESNLKFLCSRDKIVVGGTFYYYTRTFFIAFYNTLCQNRSLYSISVFITA